MEEFDVVGFPRAKNNVPLPIIPLSLIKVERSLISLLKRDPFFIINSSIDIPSLFRLNKIQLIYLPSLIYDLSIQTSKTLNLYEFINYIQVHNLFL
jgi:hypothetical protein